VDLVAPLYDRVVEGVESSALHDAAYTDERKDEGHKGKVGHLHRAGVRVLGTAAVLVVPALPVLPGRIGTRIRIPAMWIIVPVVMTGAHGHLVVTGPAVAPGIIRFAFLDIGEDVVGGD